MNYYNEIDDYAADWIENLIAAKLIPAGIVDRRSIEDVTPADLAGFDQCHFFAGIAGWSLALRIAGIPDNYPIWSGSCPCQPFSAAGAQDGFADERHLWPAFHWLISQRSPAIVVGEQVASKFADAWVDLVRADMEAMGAAFGAVAFPSASVGAPHVRDRTYWVAHTDSVRREQVGCYPEGNREPGAFEAGNRSSNGSTNGGQPRVDTGAMRLADSHRQRRDQTPIIELPGYAQRYVESCGVTGRVEHTNSITGRQGCTVNRGGDSGSNARKDTGLGRSVLDCRPGPTNGFWSAADWLACRDGKWRPVEPGTFPLADGVPARVGRLRAYGNAINPWQAARFLTAALPP